MKGEKCDGADEATLTADVRTPAAENPLTAVLDAKSSVTLVPIGIVKQCIILHQLAQQSGDELCLRMVVVHLDQVSRFRGGDSVPRKAVRARFPSGWRFPLT